MPFAIVFGVLAALVGVAVTIVLVHRCRREVKKDVNVCEEEVTGAEKVRE